MTSGRVRVQVFARSLNPVLASRVIADPEVCGKERSPDSIVLGSKGELANTLVWLEPQGNTPPARKKASVEMELKNCQFSPRLVVVGTATPVRILNRDPILYNLRGATSANKPFSRSFPPNLMELVLEFERPEIIRISCDIHPWVRGFVVVTDSSWYSITNSSGEVVFDQIPYGTYRLWTWHEIVGGSLEPQVVNLNEKSVSTVINLGNTQNLEIKN